MKIRDNIYSIGVTDKDIRIFHGYATPVGTTYNSYLILDEQITLIDFVKVSFSDELLKNIRDIIGDKKIDNMICNHVEPDHSGALPFLIKQYPEATVYGVAKCEAGLKAYYPDINYNFNIVKSGDTLKTGKYTFSFLPMPMVHWPDSMATYMPEEKILFPNDALGQHSGTGEIYDYELGLEKLIDRAGNYYANIVLPFGKQVAKVLEALKGLDIGLVCPSHGVILKDYIGEMVEKYDKWCQNYTDSNKVIIVYDTMWGTTEKMAKKISKECSLDGLNVELINLSDYHYSYAMGKLLEAKHIYVGSPTLNNSMLPTVSAFLTYMKGLKPKNRIGKAFGSYGWSGEAPKQINDILASCGFEMKDLEKALWNI